MPSVEENIRRLDRQVERFKFQVGSVIDDVLNRLFVELESNPLPPREIAERLGTIERELNRNGMDRIISQVSRDYGSILSDVRDSLRQGGVNSTFSDSDLNQFQAVTEVNLQVLREKVRDFASSVRSQTARASLSGQRPLPLIDILERNKERLLRSIEVELVNALQGFRNAVTLRKAKQGGAKRLLYDGPRDSKNRPFCASRVGQDFTLDEISKMDNEQGLPVITNLGGWNCRHEWRPVKNG